MYLGGKNMYIKDFNKIPIGQDEFSDFKEYNEEVFRYICKKILKSY